MKTDLPFNGIQSTAETSGSVLKKLAGYISS